MKWQKKKIADGLFLMTIGLMLAWSLVIGILSVTVLPIDYVPNLLRMFLLLLLGMLIFSHRYLTWVAGAIVLSAALFLLYGFSVNPEEMGVAQRAAETLEQTVQFALGNALYEPLYERIIVWSLHVAIGFVVLMFGYVDKRFLPLLAIFTGAFAGLMITPIFAHRTSFYLFCFCIFAFLVRDLSQTLQRGTKKSPLFLGAMVLTLVAMGIANLIPPPNENVQETLNRPMETINRAILEAQTANDFAISYIGFGEESGRLGGDLQTNDRIFMFVRTERPAPFYLTGAIYDIYTGESWEMYDREATAAFSPRGASFFTDDSEMFRLQRMDINIIHSSSTVFQRGIMREVTSAGADFVFLEHENGRIRTDSPMPRGTWYTIRYFHVPNLPEREVLERQHQMPTDLMLEAAFVERYTALPENFPERVRDLAREVTAGATNDYQRARMLEAHLRTQYPYTLTPGALPAGRDFVEHFLFDVQAGYCVHFATAFVTMARSVGLMARYVEGFLVGGVPTADGYFQVRNNMGHAWAEVYFPGVGWQLFEPTPSGAFPGQTMTELPFMPERPLPSPPPIQIQAPAPTPNLPELPNVGGGIVSEVMELERQERDIGAATWVLLGIVALMCALAGRMFYVMRRESRRGRLGNREAVEENYQRLLRYMALLGKPMQAGETRGEFLRRWEETAALAEICERARYSEHEICLEERRQVQKVVLALEESVKMKLGKWRFALQKYVVGGL